MTDGARKHFVLGGAIALLGMVVVVLLLRGGDKGGDKDGEKGTGHGRAWPAPVSFTISGDATEPITPGASASIDLEFTNRRPLPLAVNNVQVRVREVRAPHADAQHPCTVDDYTVQQVPQRTRFSIPARDTRTLSALGLTPQTWPRVGLVDRPVNQDGCKGATLELDYSASGSIRW